MKPITSIRGLRSRLLKLGWTERQVRIAWAMKRDRCDGLHADDALPILNEWLCAWLGSQSPEAAKAA